MLTDITDKRRTEQQLEEHRQHLEREVQARTLALEAANKELGVRILVSEDTWHDAREGFEFRELDRLALRGRSREERVFELLGVRGDVPEARTRLRDLFDAGLAAHRSGDRTAAVASFERCVEMAPDDRPSRLMLDRAGKAAAG